MSKTVSKVFETPMSKQNIDYIEYCLSSLLCGFCKGYNAQYALVKILESGRQV